MMGSLDWRMFQADDSVDEEVLNHYCWMFSQFDIPPDFKVKVDRQLRQKA